MGGHAGSRVGSYTQAYGLVHSFSSLQLCDIELRGMSMHVGQLVCMQLSPMRLVWGLKSVPRGGSGLSTERDPDGFSGGQVGVWARLPHAKCACS